MTHNADETGSSNATHTVKTYDILREILAKPIGPIKQPAPDVKRDSEKMLKHALEVFKLMKEGQIRKQKMAAIVMEKAYERYEQIKLDQLHQLNDILALKDEMNNNLAQISAKCEKAIERSISLSNQVNNISSSIVCSSKLSKAEKAMKDRLLQIEKCFTNYRDSLRQLESRYEYINGKIKPSLLPPASVKLDESYVEDIAKSLDRQSESIFDLVERVNRIKLQLAQDDSLSQSLNQSCNVSIRQ